MFLFALTLAIVAAVLVYFLPAMVAISRNHLNAMAIFLTNLLLGWTVLGWVVAFIWSFTNNPLAAADKDEPAIKLWKFILLLLVFLVMPALVVIGIKIKPANHGDATSAPVSAPAPAVAPAPPVKMGVPVPADELLGK
ncbi:MAG: superinfection immunity protein [Alphaproteobacteria bacterium]|nr:superinfection immunity protein [Alphaproteobacteria bacterium]